MAKTENPIIYSIVIPLKDEEENIVELIGEIEEVMATMPATLSGAFEIICVDDGSTDRSVEILQNLRKEKSHLQLIAFKGNFSQSSALAAGFYRAKGTFVITLDADRQNDPKDIPELVKQIEDVDMVNGWRIQRDDPLQKRFISKIANYTRSRICKDGMHDTGCGLKICRREALQKIKMYRGMHRFLPALFLIEGFRVKEIPVTHRKRVKGETKYRLFSRGIRPIVDMFVIRWMRDRALRYEVRDDA